MSPDQPPHQPPSSSHKEQYSDPRRPKPFSPSLQRASYHNDDMIWPAPADVYSDAQPTLPKNGREIAVKLNLPTLIVIGTVVLLLVGALFATTLLHNTAEPGKRSATPGGAIAQATIPVAATFTPPVISPTTLPSATPGGGKPVAAPTRSPSATKTPVATPTPLICNATSTVSSPVTLFGDDISGGSGSGTTIGSLLTLLAVDRAVSGNTCVVTRIQQIVNVNLNNAPETAGSTCTSSNYPCIAQGTISQIDQTTKQVVFTNTNGYSFGGQVSRNIYGGTDNAPPGTNQCVVGTTEYIDNFSRTHQGGSVTYCW